MSVDYARDVKPVADIALELAASATRLIPGPAGVVAQGIAAALRWISDLAGRGLNPVTAIEAAHAADATLAGVEAHWAEKLRQRFPAGK